MNDKLALWFPLSALVASIAIVSMIGYTSYSSKQPKQVPHILSTDTANLTYYLQSGDTMRMFLREGDTATIIATDRDYPVTWDSDTIKTSTDSVRYEISYAPPRKPNKKKLKYLTDLKANWIPLDWQGTGITIDSGHVIGSSVLDHIDTLYIPYTRDTVRIYVTDTVRWDNNRIYPPQVTTGTENTFNAVYGWNESKNWWEVCHNSCCGQCNIHLQHKK